MPDESISTNIIRAASNASAGESREEIRSWAMAMLAGVEIDDLDGGSEEQKGYKSLLSGPRPDGLLHS